MRTLTLLIVLMMLHAPALRAAVGDPQIRTDHPWYPGELSCSTFERLFATQAALYQRVTGRQVNSDEDKALASWYWRNLHYAHGEDGRCDVFAKGFDEAEWNRDYWTGLFAHGFGLCGTTHAQYTAEINALLGHCRGRVTGVTGHNSFEVYLSGGAYGAGRWALLDHDVSTVIFSVDGTRLLSIPEVKADLKTLKDPGFKPARQRGWRVAGLHDGDAGAYSSFTSVEYLAGYAGPPPMVHLRRGEVMRRYLKPGLEDGKTFVFWGRNYKTAGIPGPERSRSWVNQPEAMFNSRAGTGHRDGQARYASAVYTYAPNFGDGSYKEGVVEETADSVTFEFRTPYVIAATPPNDKPWGVYDAGCSGGLVVSGLVSFAVEVSVDGGRSFHSVTPRTTAARNAFDFTDRVKGHNQYLLRFGATAAALKDASLSWRTVCQMNAAVIPRLRDGVNRITYHASGQALTSAGPTLAQAGAHTVEGAAGSPEVTLELRAPRGEKPTRVYAASWNSSGNPPADVKYAIGISTNGGRAWAPLVTDWSIVRRPPEPGDFWSQSFCWGEGALDSAAGPVRIRFGNTGRRPYRKVEGHLAYNVSNPSPLTVSFCWRELGGAEKTASRTYAGESVRADASWTVTTGRETETRWVEFAAR
jgi:hypothetical protein